MEHELYELQKHFYTTRNEQSDLEENTIAFGLGNDTPDVFGLRNDTHEGLRKCVSNVNRRKGKLDEFLAQMAVIKHQARCIEHGMIMKHATSLPAGEFEEFDYTLSGKLFPFLFGRKSEHCARMGSRMNTLRYAYELIDYLGYLTAVEKIYKFGPCARLYSLCDQVDGIVREIFEGVKPAHHLDYLRTLKNVRAYARLISEIKIKATEEEEAPADKEEKRNLLSSDSEEEEEEEVEAPAEEGKSNE